MSRRPHRKSRNGCLECKRRHIRCDEQYPICASCSSAEIRCSFLARSSPQIVPAFSNGHLNVGASSPPSTPALTPTATISPGHNMSSQKPLDTFNINMTHLKLFNNLFSKEFLSLEESGQVGIIPTTIYVKFALVTPYIMYQLLATSALELSIRTAESRDLYREYATGLHSRALTFFNESNPVLEVTEANCVPMFLFSSMVGVYLLCETLHYQRDSLGGFIESFTQCLSVYRGVLAIANQCGHLLRETELEPSLGLSEILAQSTDDSGTECDTLKALINATDIAPSSRKAYEESVLFLQNVFDVKRTVSGDKMRMHVALAWPIFISPDFLDLVRQQQAEALAILAHYAVLLLSGRDFWLIGDGGQFLIESICGRLGSNWEEWLKFPRGALRVDLIA